jgi:hypothetical protein
MAAQCEFGNGDCQTRISQLEQTNSELGDETVRLNQCIEDMNTANQSLREALEFCHMAIDHALTLGYCGEGSTKGICEDAVKRAETALGEEDEDENPDSDDVRPRSR